MKRFQVAIIGGGVIGSAVARELSRYNLDVIVFEKGSDVAAATSKANSGVIHSGINSPPLSLKARFCVEGNQMLQALADDLGFPIKWVGKYIIAKNNNEIKELEQLKDVGEKNKVPGLKIVDHQEVKKKEPNLSCSAGLWVPTAGIMLPYQFTIALAENAAENDVHFMLETQITDLKKDRNRFLLKTTRGEFQTDVVVNAAGIRCRDIMAMVEEPDIQVYPCRGEYLVLDKMYQTLITSMIYPVPEKGTGVLGVHITPTIEGNILLGPSAEFIDDPDDTKTTQTMMTQILKESKEIIPLLPKKAVITAYAGIRCKLASPESGGWADYRIEESKEVSGMINLLGIESPGLTAAPAIAQEVVKLVSNHIELKEKPDFRNKRLIKPRFSNLATGERDKLINKDQTWGRIICRCEHVTEAEVIDALSNPLHARTLSSVKNRCRAGMGRCQGGFCTQHIVRIMQEHFGMTIADIKLKSPQSHLFTGKTRGEDTD